MFHSVQLNVNNPHFLIMQGRINKVSCGTDSLITFTAEIMNTHPSSTPCTCSCASPSLHRQVCNMKPAEIMSLLEEASGTRMYEKKKEKAMQTMEKKDQKLKEIEAVLNEEIPPAVEKLKKQCSDYNEWAELSSCRERLKRFLVAYDYTECRK